MALGMLINSSKCHERLTIPFLINSVQRHDLVPGGGLSAAHSPLRRHLLLPPPMVHPSLHWLDDGRRLPHPCGHRPPGHCRLPQSLHLLPPDSPVSTEMTFYEFMFFSIFSLSSLSAFQWTRWACSSLARTTTLSPTLPASSWGCSFCESDHWTFHR